MFSQNMAAIVFRTAMLKEMSVSLSMNKETFSSQHFPQTESFTVPRKPELTINMEIGLDGGLRMFLNRCRSSELTQRGVGGVRGYSGRTLHAHLIQAPQQLYKDTDIVPIL